MTDLMTTATQNQHQIEQLFAGAVMSGPDYARAKASWLSPDVFTDERLSTYWDKVRDGGNPIEVGFEMGLAAELTKWSLSVVSVNDIESYAKSLQRAAYLRYAVMGAQDIVKAVQAGNVAEIDAILDAMKDQSTGVPGMMRDPDEVAENLKKRIELGNISIPYGIETVDYATSGAERGTCTVLAGRTSMGKSSLAFQWAEYQALVLGVRVAFFALEMSAEQMVARRLCHKVKNKSGQSASWEDVRSSYIGEPEKQHLYTLIDEYNESIKGKLFISDLTEVSTSDILQTQLREKYDVIYIDHLGLLKDRPRQGERYDQLLGRIVMSLHELAKNTRACVFVLAQLKRAVADRESKRPRLDDLQDSTKIESNADNVILLDRPSYWDRTLQEDPDPMELILAKYRDGSRSSTCWVGFNLREQRFVSIERPDLDELVTEGLEEANGQSEIPF